MLGPLADQSNTATQFKLWNVCSKIIWQCTRALQRKKENGPIMIYPSSFIFKLSLHSCSGEEDADNMTVLMRLYQ